MKNIAATRNRLLLGAVALGLALGGRVAFLDPFAMPILMVITTVSMSGFAWREFRRPLLLARPLAVGIILNQLLLGGAMLACAWALVDDPLLRAGFVLVAAAPALAATSVVSSARASHPGLHGAHHGWASP